MNKVIVLIDNESRQSNFINSYSLGKDPHLTTLCRAMTTAEKKQLQLFNFEIFGLFTESKKLSDFIKTHDGIIISIDSENFRKNPNLFVSRIKHISDNNQTKPIAIVIDYNQEIKCDDFLKKLIELSNKNVANNSLHKTFICPYTNSGVIMYMHNDIYTYSTKIESWFVSNLKNTKTSHAVDISKLSSKTINPIDLMKQFYNCTLPIDIWDHYGRLRVVWCSLVRFGLNDSINQNGWLCSSWKRYKTSIGHGDKWNYTLTRFWTETLWKLQALKKYKTFDSLWQDNQHIQSGKLFQEYYGNEIFSLEAKNNWIPPKNITNVGKYC